MNGIKLFLIVICGLLAGCGWPASLASSGSNEEMWCALNSGATAVDVEGADEIQPNDIHIPSPQRQAAMQELLRRTDFLQIRPEMAKNFVPTLDEHEEEKLYYLVRSAALYEENSDSFENLRFSAVYFSEVKTLNIYFFGLAARAVPKNIALLIAVKHHVSKVNSLCEIGA